MTNHNFENQDLDSLLPILNKGDVVTAMSISELGHSAYTIHKNVTAILEKGAVVYISDCDMTLSNNTDRRKGRLEMLSLLADMSESIRKAGIKKAQADGKYENSGRKKKVTRQNVLDAMVKANGDKKKAAKLLNCSVPTVYRLLKN